MTYVMTWISVHRGWFLGSVALSIWVLANYWYFRMDIARFRRGNKPHTWSVDMEAKTGKGGRKSIR